MSGPPIPGNFVRAGGSVLQGMFLHPPAAAVRPGIQPKSRQPLRPGQAAFPVSVALASRGAPLAAAIQAKMERAFGTSFANVRIHMGPQPAMIGALALTQGENIHFAPGQFAPHTPRGLFLLAHELAHVVQQRSRRVINPFGAGIAVVQNANLEAEADRVAQRISSSLRMPAAPPRFAPVPSGVGRSLAIQRMEEKKPRPSREERAVNRVVFKTTSKSDKEGRTRGGKEAKAKLKKFADEGWDVDDIIANLDDDSPPVRLKVTGDLIFKGSRSFPADFSEAFWDAQADPPKCCICGGDIAKKERTIEHRKPWATLKTEMPTLEVCKKGKHWTVVTRKAALKVICDGNPVPDDKTFKQQDPRPNLKPAHKGCNSSKSGPKDTDAISPQPSYTKHTEDCALIEAE